METIIIKFYIFYIIIPHQDSKYSDKSRTELTEEWKDPLSPSAGPGDGIERPSRWWLGRWEINCRIRKIPQRLECRQPSEEEATCISFLPKILVFGFPMNSAHKVNAFQEMVAFMPIRRFPI